MKEVRITLYSIKELDEQAQYVAYSEWLPIATYPWASENEASLKAFADEFGIKIRHWEYGGYERPSILYDIVSDSPLYSLKGIRLWKYLQNNPHLVPQKECPYTGYYMDEVLLAPIRRFMSRPDNKTTFADLVREALNEWVRACDDDHYEYFSFENFLNECENHQWLFFPNGKMFHEAYLKTA